MNVRIPFDSLVMEAVTEEIQSFVGGRVQGIRQPDDRSIAIALYASGREAMLLLSAHPEFARVHFISRRPPNQPSPPVFCATLRARIEGGSLVSARQIGGDRILELDFESEAGRHRLVTEIMGKHSNLILLESGDRIVSALKWVHSGMSARPIVSNGSYLRPPTFDPSRDNRSPFLKRLIEAGGLGRPFHPIIAPGHGAYPVSVAPLGLVEHSRSSISVALENHFETLIRDFEREGLRHSLTAQLERALLARETALLDLRQALEAGQRAGKVQLCGELILTYGGSIRSGDSLLKAYDYDGQELEIALDPELDFKQNANAYFERARRAKGRLGLVRDQIARREEEASAVRVMLDRARAEIRLDALRALQEEAQARRWLNQQSPTGAKPKDERPFEGHRIRELLGPNGFPVLYGENAEGNDYLTLRVAKPSDWWLHVRGATSAHVVIRTRNQPERAGPEVLQFAARIAVQHSPSKHSGYVPVDYTLKKYVRKPRGAAKGTALYTHEKTIHVESGI